MVQQSGCPYCCDKVSNHLKIGLETILVRDVGYMTVMYDVSNATEAWLVEKK